MDRTTRTSILLIAAGISVALLSFLFQHMMLRKLKAVQTAKSAQTAGGPASNVAFGSATRPAQAAPAAPVAPTTPCRDKLKACLAATGKDAGTIQSLGDCYVACADAKDASCGKDACSNVCEAVFGIRDTCP